MSIIIRHELIDAVLRGDKTQHRVVVRDLEELRGGSDCLYVYRMDYFPSTPYSEPDGNVRWCVGETYAVQSILPDRSRSGVWLAPDGSIAPLSILTEDRYFYQVTTSTGRKWYRAHGYTPLRVRITAIRRERLTDISEEDARAEGMQFDPIGSLYHVPGDPAICFFTAIEAYRLAWDTHHTRKGQRWGDAPDVWVLTFEVVQ
jgi:hypothetical protein